VLENGLEIYEDPSAIRASIGGLTSGVLDVPGMEMEVLHPR
jgi:hypothetical protein